MLDDNGPLLFINTVSTKAKASNQNTFDSRKVNNRNTIDPSEYKKLVNIVEMYKKNRPVLCRLITTKCYVEAIPYQLDDRILLMRTQDGKIEKLDITSLIKIEIIRF